MGFLNYNIIFDIDISNNLNNTAASIGSFAG